MPINPLISNKIQNGDMPDKIKKILNEILNAENEMDVQNTQKDHKPIDKLLEKYADDEQVRSFCENYD